jgi:DNA-binding MarR family transcriptional regulator
MDTPDWHKDVVTPALLRHARNTYGMAMRKALEAAGFDDLPGNALYIIGGLALGAGDTPLGKLIRELRISRQSAGQLVDTLVARGYLERAVDADDRRKLNITLTERGRAAAAAQSAARAAIDRELIEKAGIEDVETMRRALAILIDMNRDRDGDEPEG